MDNGAQKTVAGYEAYEKYCKFTKTSVDLTPSKELYRFGNHVQPSVGLTVIRFPIDDRGNYLEYPTDVVMVDLPVLFGFDMMKKMGYYINEVTDEFIKNETRINVYS